jgi:hypothetical protein
MKFKWTIPVMMLLLAVLAMGCASASDNSTDDAALSQGHVDELAMSDNEIISSSNSQPLGTSNGGTFTELQAIIDNAQSGSTVTLSRDYSYNPGFIGRDSYEDSGIAISKPLTINGNGHTINGKSQSRIFHISSTVVLKNIRFTNGYSYDSGGAILNSGGANCRIVSCEFTNCDGRWYGGAISNSGKDCTITSCKFTKCSARFGSAIYNKGTKATISGCKFTQCSGSLEGAITNDASGCRITSSEFSKCRNAAGAIQNWADSCTVKSCTFTKITGEAGSVVKNAAGSKFSIKSCKFTDCSCGDGYIISNNGKKATIASCTFTDSFGKNHECVYSKHAGSNVIKLKLFKAKVSKSAKRLDLKVTLKKGNSPLKSKKVTFKFKGKKYKAKTDRKGVAKITIDSKILKKLKVGKKVKITASYAKNEVACSVKVKK